MGGGAVGEHVVHAEVVALVTVWARVWGRFIFPKTSIVGIRFSGLHPKKPLVPCQSSKFQWIPRGRVKMFMGVLDNEIMGEYFMWGQHKLPSIHNVRGGLWGVRGGLG